MNVLLDTHVLLWWLDDYKALPPTVLASIEEGENTIYVSAASAWEIAIKKALKKLKAPDNLAEALETSRFSPLPITVSHALHAGKLPRHHDDPFDRMLIAQAQSENLTLISQDQRFKQYKVSLLWK